MCLGCTHNRDSGHVLLNRWNPTLLTPGGSPLSSLEPRQAGLCPLTFWIQVMSFSQRYWCSLLNTNTFGSLLNILLLARLCIWTNQNQMIRFIKIHGAMSQPLFPVGNLIQWASGGWLDPPYSLLSCFLGQGHSHFVMMEGMKRPRWSVYKNGKLKIWTPGKPWWMRSEQCSVFEALVFVCNEPVGLSDILGWPFLIISQILSNLWSLGVQPSRQATDCFIPLCLGIPIFHLLS